MYVVAVFKVIALAFGMTASDMPHKFKIGDIVNYYPKDHMLNAIRGTYTVTGIMPTGGSQQPEYRIRHRSEDFERVAFENELSVA
jgi:hypothetical protein